MLTSFDFTRLRRSRTVALVAVAAAAFVLNGSPATWANNDPHRVYLPASPYDISADVCGFTVHVDIPVDRQYGTFSTASDGSTILKVTGSLVQTFTNESNGNSITLNSSGPAKSLTFPVGTSLLIVSGSGLNTVFVTNGAEFGVPNFMYTSGLLEFTTDLSTDTIVSMPRQPHILLDICAALA
jgi:hypothetical protein